MTQRHYEETLPGGRHWSFIMRHGHQLRLTDLEGGANVGMLFYNPTMTLERINIPDTLKCQHTLKLTRGHCIYSDMGRIFCSITEDTAGWHDAIGGTCDRALVEKKWGARNFQEYRNEYLRNGRDSFLIQLAKYGMNKRDLAANLNLFSRVIPDNHGNLHIDSTPRSGASVTLRFDMDTLVIMHTCPHPMDTSATYPAKPVHYVIETAPPIADDDVCKRSHAENARGLLNNALFNMHHHTHAAGGCHDH